jgi:Bacterial PH domain
VILGPSERIAIPFSRMKCLLILAVALVFVVTCAYFATHSEGQHRYSPMFIRIVCGIGVPFFGAIAIMSLLRLVDSRPGLVVDRQGIDDRSSFASVGRVDWADIDGLRVTRARWNNGLVVELHEPERFARRGNLVQRLLRFGAPSPVVLGSNALDVPFDTMVQIVRRFHDDWKSQAKRPLSPGPLGV